MNSSFLSLLNHVPFPISTKPRTVLFPSKRSSFRVDITKRERKLFERKRDEAERFIEKRVANLSKEDKKKEISSWINKNLQGKEKKKQDTIDFGGILGSSKFDLMLFMLTKIGVKLPEEMELTKEVEDPEKTQPARKDRREEKEKEAEKYNILSDSQQLKNDKEAEKYYEEEEARLNAKSASKHPVEERRTEHTKSEDYEDLADAEELKEGEDEARLLFAAVGLFIELKEKKAEIYNILANSQKVKDDKEAEKYYEEEEARLNAKSASKHPVEERRTEHTKSEDYEDLADAEELKEGEDEARLLFAAVGLFIELKKLYA